MPYKKIVCISAFVLFINLNGSSQTTFYSYSLPGASKIDQGYNSFIGKSSISWACELSLSYPFYKKPGSNFYIIDYLVNAQRSGKIKSYIDFDVEKKWLKAKRVNYYTEINKGYLAQAQIPKEPSNTIYFHEIFYIENHKLKSHIIAAGPGFNVTTDIGINLGSTVAAFSCLNYYPGKPNAQNDEIISLGNIYTLLNFDSLEAYIGIKKTYGLNLTENIWHNLSNGFNKAVDLRNNKVIPAEQVIDYPIDDEISVPSYDSLGNIIGTGKEKRAPAKLYFYTAGISQNFYYNKTKDFFYSTIDYIDIYTKFYNQETMNEAVEKRFKVSF